LTNANFDQLRHITSLKLVKQTASDKNESWSASTLVTVWKSFTECN